MRLHHPYDIDIEKNRVRPVGANQELPVDVRILSASHKPLARLVERGQFRQDLYYRLNVIELPRSSAVPSWPP